MLFGEQRNKTDWRRVIEIRNKTAAPSAADSAMKTGATCRKGRRKRQTTTTPGLSRQLGLRVQFIANNYSVHPDIQGGCWLWQPKVFLWSLRTQDSRVRFHLLVKYSQAGMQCHGYSTYPAQGPDRLLKCRTSLILRPVTCTHMCRSINSLSCTFQFCMLANDFILSKKLSYLALLRCYTSPSVIRPFLLLRKWCSCKARRY